MMSPSPLLQVESLSCIRDDRELFCELSFQLGTGQVLLLEGKNGSGKTSLLRILCGFREADAGHIRWRGNPISDRQYHADMAYIGHLDGIKKELTVLENLNLALAFGQRGQYTLPEALARVQLAGYQQVLAQALSAGQKRRMSLARLLVTNNHLWILDEPFTSLDKQGIQLTETLMTEHCSRGGLIVLTSHHDLNLTDVDIQRIHLS